MRKVSHSIILLLCSVHVKAVRTAREKKPRKLVGDDNNEKTLKGPSFYSTWGTKEDAVYRGPSSCPSNTFQMGYSNLRRLMLDMAASTTQGSFNICPGTVLNIGEDFEADGEGDVPLVIPFDNVIINCGDDGSFSNKCVLNGGLIQVALSGKNITLNGLRFTGSAGISILGAGSSDSYATFNDCAWKNNLGYSAVYSQYVNEKTLENSISDPDMLENFMIDKGELPVGTNVKVDGMKLTFNNCFFKENKFSSVVIHTKRSVLSLSSVMFQENNGDMADIILAYSSKLEMKDSCFIDEGNKLLGSIYVGDDSSVEEINNYETGTIGGFNCNNILYSDFQCSSFSESKCVVNPDYYDDVSQDSSTEVSQNEITSYNSAIRGPELCSSDSDVTGYKNIRRMLLDMETFDSSSELTKQAFNLCPNTVYNISTNIQDTEGDLPLLIPFDNVVLNCGQDGSVANNCVLSGGLAHIILSGSNITVNGITFQESQGVSVMALGASTSSATFNNCIWANNKGYSAVYSKFNDKNLVQKAISDPEVLDNLLADQGEVIAMSLSNPTNTTDEPGMQLVFSNCKYNNNIYLSAGVIQSVSSRIVLLSTIFENNRIMKADVILDKKSTSYMTDTCFDKGDRIYGNIYVSSDATFYQSNNYAQAGSTTKYDCDDIYQEEFDPNCNGDDTSCISSSCMTFSSKYCVPTKVEKTSVAKQTYNAIYKGPGPCTSNANETGYDNLRRLINDINTLNSTNSLDLPTSTFNLCSNTVYRISDGFANDPNAELPLLIPFDDITINCGADGYLQNKCLIFGGMAHLILSGKNITINGVAFRGSKGVSVMAIGDSASDVVFNNCLWIKNKGKTVIYAQYDSRNLLETAMYDLDALDALILDSNEQFIIPAVEDAGMSLTFYNCSFRENPVLDSLIYSGYSTLVVDNTDFDSNYPQVSDIILNNTSLAAIKNSCFLNQTSSYGSIFVSSDSTILSKQNYGDSLSAQKQYGCNDIFEQGINDTYQCISFTASFCMSEIDESDLIAISSSAVPTNPDPVNVPQPQPVSSAPFSLSFTISAMVTLILSIYYLRI